MNRHKTCAVPAFVKVLELTYPYPCTVQIFLLMLGYSITLAGLMFLGNLLRARFGMVLGIVFSGFGLFLNPDIISQWFHLSIYYVQTWKQIKHLQSKSSFCLLKKRA